MIATFNAGSSPRLWGTPSIVMPLPYILRFIPTPVGNTCPGAGRPGPGPVHPHACGEHVAVGASYVRDTGSSPRLWGTLQNQPILLPLFRFIPTPVGNTAPGRESPRPRPVHPHACGEHGMPRRGAWAATGSSPRLWGTPGREGDPLAEDRFIPTPVGNTPRARTCAGSPPVHPHACGEHCTSVSAAVALIGSSPRLWGTLLAVQAHGDNRRFIPTPVGNTGSGWSRPALASVHPHACGEHRWPRRRKRPGAGSSPRLWGTLLPFTHFPVSPRFIPTPVGNTHRPGGHRGPDRFIPTPVGNTF